MLYNRYIKSAEPLAADSVCYVLFWCGRCNDINMEFKAVSMARSVASKEDPAFASRESFKARGTEHAFSLNGR